MGTIKNKLCLVAVLLAMLTATVFTGFVPVNTAYAAESNTGNNFDNTSVTDDLAEYGLSQFVYNKHGTIRFVTLAEYCFSANALNAEHYALYVYLCNPARLDISERQGANTINIAVAYDENGKTCDYANLTLKMCGIAKGE